MGTQAEEPEPSLTPRLPLLSSEPLAHVHMQSPERSGMLTPPLYTAASVPFRWEEKPGKPRLCTILSKSSRVDFPPKCLELPPRLLLDSNFTQLSSPITLITKSRFQSSSFRIIRREQRRVGSFRLSCSPQGGQLGDMVLSKRGFWGSWRLGRRACKAKRELGGSSYVFPSSVDKEANNEEEHGNIKRVQMASIRRTGSFSAPSPARSQFWVTIYDGLRHVIPWKSRKLKKEGLAI